MEITHKTLMRDRPRPAEWISQKQHERGDTARLRQLVTGLTAFAVIAAAGFMFTFTEWNPAAQQRSLMISLAIVDRVNHVSASDPSITAHADAVTMVAFSADKPKPRPDPPESPKPSTPPRCPSRGC